MYWKIGSKLSNKRKVFISHVL